MKLIIKSLLGLSPLLLVEYISVYFLMFITVFVSFTKVSSSALFEFVQSLRSTGNPRALRLAWRYIVGVHGSYKSCTGLLNLIQRWDKGGWQRGVDLWSWMRLRCVKGIDGFKLRWLQFTVVVVPMDFCSKYDTTTDLQQQFSGTPRPIFFFCCYRWTMTSRVRQ